MKKLLTLTAIAASLLSGTSMAITPTEKNFNDTGDILARSKQHTNIEYDIMVQRATQAAIYYMPAVAQVDFIKALKVLTKVRAENTCSCRQIMMENTVRQKRLKQKVTLSYLTWTHMTLLIRSVQLC
jgi:hypothetical protein